jgi:hypothetical protein
MESDSKNSWWSVTETVYIHNGRWLNLAAQKIADNLTHDEAFELIKQAADTPSTRINNATRERIVDLVGETCPDCGRGIFEQMPYDENAVKCPDCEHTSQRFVRLLDE